MDLKQHFLERHTSFTAMIKYIYETRNVSFFRDRFIENLKEDLVILVIENGFMDYWDLDSLVIIDESDDDFMFITITYNSIPIMVWSPPPPHLSLFLQLPEPITHKHLKEFEYWKYYWGPPRDDNNFDVDDKRLESVFQVLFQ